MNTEKIEGKFDQVAGKIKQNIGEAVGNERLANSGVADQVKGAAKETWGNAKDTANAVHDDVHARTVSMKTDYDAHLDHTDHNVRDSIVGTAKAVRNAVNEKLDDVKSHHEHERTR